MFGPRSEAHAIQGLLFNEAEQLADAELDPSVKTKTPRV
jgi:hypothetical protein